MKKAINRIGFDNSKNKKNSSKKIKFLKNKINEAEVNLKNAKKILDELLGIKKIDITKEAREIGPSSSSEEIFGLFDGENMCSTSGKKYPISVNYASKSKLVTGDKLKLIILKNGTFVYKQIKPTKRKRLIGTLKIEKNKFVVQSEGRDYLILPASITYFKARVGDKLVIVVPEKKESKWAAVEAILP